MDRIRVTYPYPQRRTRKFLGLKVAGGLVAYLICLTLYLAVLAGFTFFLVWGGTKIVAHVWQEESSAQVIEK